MSEAFRCSECHMTFGTIGLLQKHKRKFCVGGSIGDPDSLLLRKGLYSADSPRPRPLSPDSRPVEIGANRKYERLREQEVVPGYGGPLPPRVQFDRQDNISPMSDTSISIHLEGEQNVYKRPREDYGGKGLGVKAKTDYPHYNPNQDAQLRQLAETHGRTMEYLQTKNKDLEKQREDIRRRLEQLGQKGPAQDNTADLLAELRAQEERNQRSLNELRRQLYEMGQKRVNVIEVEKPMNYPQPIIQQAPPPPLPPPEKEKRSYIYPVYYGSSLVAEITAMRQAYLQNGGNDPDVLSQLSQMQAEAQKIEDEMKNANYDNRHRDKKPDLSGKMQMIELENERLHKELLLLQEQNFLNQNKRKSDREGKYQGHSFHNGEGQYKQSGDGRLSRIYNDLHYQKQVDSARSHQTEYDLNNKPTWKKVVFPTKTESIHSYPKSGYQKLMNVDENWKKHPQESYPSANKRKPVVPPLDLSSITGQKPREKSSELPRVKMETGSNLWKVGENYTFVTEKKRKHHKPVNINDYKHVLPNKPLPKLNVLPDIPSKQRNLGRSQSLYAPKKKPNSGSLKGSIRSELISRSKDLDQYMYPRKAQMMTGDSPSQGFVGIIQPKQSKNNDMKYETVTIKQREELNPDNNHVIHTTTYKEEKLNGAVA